MSSFEEITTYFDELIEYQKKKLLQEGKRVLPHITSDDILQPNDFPELENSSHFRYEEGILGGIQMAKSAILASLKEKVK
ncbi:MAG TPA: hypothetical protein VLG44_06685 [Chlamydiales bacterium]|nr:hypothetical protein [Chlamydiales bacterium]